MRPPSGGPDKLDSWLLLLPHCLGGGRGRPLPLASGRPRALEAELGKRGSPKRPVKGLGVGWAGCWTSVTKETLPFYFILFFRLPGCGLQGAKPGPQMKKNVMGSYFPQGGVLLEDLSHPATLLGSNNRQGLLDCSLHILS